MKAPSHQSCQPRVFTYAVSSGAARGFTLIEVLVVISILGILAALAGPSFTPTIERWRVRQAAEGLTSTIYYARSEAIKRGGRVVVQKIPNDTNGCKTAPDNTDWDCGWLVFGDTNDNSTLDAGEPTLQRFDTAANVKVTRNGGAASIKVNRWGLVAGTLPSFTLLPLNASSTSTAARAVCMGAGGRIRITPSGTSSCTT